MTDNKQEQSRTEVHTSGGPYIGEDVATGGGDFIAHDKIQIVNHYHLPSPVIVVIVVIVAVIITALTAYSWSNKKPDLPTPSTQVVAIAQQMPPTATQTIPTATRVPPTITPTLIAATAEPATSPTFLTPPTSYPCEATVIPRLIGEKKISFLYISKEGNIKQGQTISVNTSVRVLESYYSANSKEIRYHIKTMGDIDYGWIPGQYLKLSTSCPQISN